MSTEYTPGPWRVVEVFRASGGRDLSIEAENEVLFCIPVTSGTEKADFANARLIAAAPEMAELLAAFATDTEARLRAGESVNLALAHSARAMLARIEREA